MHFHDIVIERQITKKRWFKNENGIERGIKTKAKNAKFKQKRGEILKEGKEIKEKRTFIKDT